MKEYKGIQKKLGHKTEAQLQARIPAIQNRTYSI